jgi:hypothetical protein
MAMNHSSFTPTFTSPRDGEKNFLRETSDFPLPRRKGRSKELSLVKRAGRDVEKVLQRYLSVPATDDENPTRC